MNEFIEILINNMNNDLPFLFNLLAIMIALKLTLKFLQIMAGERDYNSSVRLDEIIDSISKFTFDKQKRILREEIMAKEHEILSAKKDNKQLKTEVYDNKHVQEQFKRTFKMTIKELKEFNTYLKNTIEYYKNN